MKKYRLKFRRTQNGKLLGHKISIITASQEPIIGEVTNLLCDTPICQTIVEVTELTKTPIMEYTINDLISDLEVLKPSLRELPVVIVAPNGLTFTPKAKVLLDKYQTIYDEPKKMVITYK